MLAFPCSKLSSNAKGWPAFLIQWRKHNKHSHCSKSKPQRWRWTVGLVTCGAGLIGCGGGFLLWNQKQESSWLQSLMNDCQDHLPDGVRLDLSSWIDLDEEWLTKKVKFVSTVLKEDTVLSLTASFTPFKRAWENVFAWEQSQSDDPWVLLNLTRTRNFWIRQMGVASLANKTNWDDYKYRNIAQACDPQTSVALARYPHANDKFFLPPPRLHPPKEDIVKDLRHQISQLPIPDSLGCVLYYRYMALEQPAKFQNDPILMDNVTLDMYAIPGEEKKKQERDVIRCLEAIAAYTAVPDYAAQFVKGQGLAVLQRLLTEDTDARILMFVATILANVSQSTDNLEVIAKTGWVHILRQWSRHQDVALALLAQTTLANLDQDWISHDIYQDIVLVHPTQRNSGPAHLDVVFVHGLKGSAVKTWRQRDGIGDDISSCWPKDWLASDCPNVRILSIGYHTLLHRWEDNCPYEQDKRTLEGRGKDLMDKLRQAGVGCRPIVWVGHSMGGLLIKQLLSSSSQSPELCPLVSQTRGVILYSVPHHGAPIVDTMMYAKYLVFPSVEVMEMITTSPKLQSLHEQFCQIMSERSIPLLSFAEKAKTDMGRAMLKLMVVPLESSDPGFGKMVSLEVDHINTCKPVDEHDVIYQLTLSFIRNIQEELK